MQLQPACLQSESNSADDPAIDLVWRSTNRDTKGLI